MYRSNVMPKTLGGLIEDLFQGGFARHWNNEDANVETPESAPVNIQENNDAYELYLMAPGLKKEDFKIAVDRNVLTISYDHKAEPEQEAVKWLRNEYKLRSFKRSFTLNDKIDATNISARYSDGVLNLTLPKKAPVEPEAKEISVS